MVIPSGRINLMSGVEFAQDGIEGAMIPLAHDFDSMTDEERSTDPLPRLVTTLRSRTVIDHLGTTGRTDVHEKSQSNFILLRHTQHGMGCIKRLSRPVLPLIVKDSGSPIENIKAGAAVDVGSRTRRAECEVLGAMGDDVDIWKAQQAVRMRVGSAVRSPVYPAWHAHQAGAHQELEGVLPSERWPRCDLRLAREMEDLGHPTIVPRSRIRVMTLSRRIGAGGEVGRHCLHALG